MSQEYGEFSKDRDRKYAFLACFPFLITHVPSQSADRENNSSLRLLSVISLSAPLVLCVHTRLIPRKAERKAFGIVPTESSTGKRGECLDGKPGKRKAKLIDEGGVPRVARAR